MRNLSSNFHIKSLISIPQRPLEILHSLVTLTKVTSTSLYFFPWPIRNTPFFLAHNNKANLTLPQASQHYKSHILLSNSTWPESLHAFFFIRINIFQPSLKPILNFWVFQPENILKLFLIVCLLMTNPLKQLNYRQLSSVALQ